MKFSVFIVLLFSLLLAICGCSNEMAQHDGQGQNGTSTASGQQPAGGIDIDALLDAIGMPICIDQCITSLKPKIVQILRLNNTFDHFERLCEAFHSARKCVHSSGICLGANLFDTITSGLQSLCDDKKRHFIAKNEACLRGVLDGKSQQCERKCHIIQALDDFSHRPDLRGLGIAHLLELLENLGEVCSAADCQLPCFRDGLNSACPRAGGVILDGLFRPFYQLASFLQKGGSGLRKFVDEKVPKECHFLTEKESLDKMVNPKKF